MREKSLYKVPFWWNAVRERLYKMAVLLVLVMVVVVVVLWECCCSRRREEGWKRRNDWKESHFYSSGLCRRSRWKRLCRLRIALLCLPRLARLRRILLSFSLSHFSLFSFLFPFGVQSARHTSTKESFDSTFLVFPFRLLRSFNLFLLRFSTIPKPILCILRSFGVY